MLYALWQNCSYYDKLSADGGRRCGTGTVCAPLSADIFVAVNRIAVNGSI